MFLHHQVALQSWLSFFACSNNRWLDVSTWGLPLFIRLKYSFLRLKKHKIAIQLWVAHWEVAEGERQTGLRILDFVAALWTGEMNPLLLKSNGRAWHFSYMYQDLFMSYLEWYERCHPIVAFNCPMLVSNQAVVKITTSVNSGLGRALRQETSTALPPHSVWLPPHQQVCRHLPVGHLLRCGHLEDAQVSLTPNGALTLNP